MSAKPKLRGATSHTQKGRSSVLSKPAVCASAAAAALILGACFLPAEQGNANSVKNESKLQAKPMALTAAAPEPEPTVTALDNTEASEDKNDATARTETTIIDVQGDITPDIDLLAPPSLAPNEPKWETVTVKKGDNLALIFKRAGFSASQLYQVVNEAPDGGKLARIFPGQTLAFQAGDKNKLIGLKHTLSALETVHYHREDGKWKTDKLVLEPDTQLAWANGRINSSLFLAGKDAGLPQSLIMSMANIFGGVIDFALDPRKGDTFHVLYEQRSLDGNYIGSGDILALSYTSKGKTVSAYRYEDSRGDVGYYSADGVSMRKAFLLAPVDFTRISSNFNPRRLHPIYKTHRPHRGTDYAASRGTPVYAAGDGRVLKSGYTRSSGNYVVIRHGEKYTTKYLHLHKRRVASGARVKQGQVIGTVGSTGAATGPHLHYEFLVNGVHRNPRTIHRKLPKATRLAKAEMPRFKAAISSRELQLAALTQGNTLALNSTDAQDTVAPSINTQSTKGIGAAQ